MNKLGFIRIAAVTPKIKVANTSYNTQEILSCAEKARKNGAAVIVFPELSITGYTCGDLFYQKFFYDQTLASLKKICESTLGTRELLIVGFYLHLENSYYNCAALIQDGKVRGVVPKMFLPNVKEFYETRWFCSGVHIADAMTSISLFGEDVPFGHLIFHDETSSLKLGIEICEDLWVPITPGSHLALNGAHILLNLSASNDTVGKSEYRHNLVIQNSAKNICGYVYASSGVHESTTDLVFGGDSLIAENGTLLANSKLYSREGDIIYGDIDYERIQFERTYGHSFEECKSAYGNRRSFQIVLVSSLPVLDGDKNKLLRSYPKNPFVPENSQLFDQRCEDIFHIQVAGLAKRLEHSGARTAVVGISGGLDSTLALLVTAQAHRVLKRNPQNIIAVTMPGFGTTGKTYQNAMSIMKSLGTTVREISIKDAVLQHFSDIGHNPENHNITYENAQARERTQILMDIANQMDGLVVGTGDLSEVALGWSTYNGDHMSMYGVNCGIPKTLVRFVIQWVMDHYLSDSEEEKKFSSDNVLLKNALHDIMGTPISPELLPPDKDGKIVQKTEDTVGPYVLHDFFLFYTIRYGMPPKKLLYIAKATFADEYDEASIKKWLMLFYRRFFAQQFKRSCMPDGPKVGSVSLSPRGDWRMPSDADPSIWLSELE